MRLTIILRVTSYGIVGILALFLFLSLVVSETAAHESREMNEFDFTVGFREEPAFEGQENAAFIAISSFSSPLKENEARSIPLNVDLRVEIIYTATRDSKVLKVEPISEVSGEYEARFIPTAPGNYSFRFFGEIDGEQIDETFTGGSETFDDVAPARGIQFPFETASLREVQNSALSARELAAEARNSASSLRTLAWIAIAVGTSGFLVGLANVVWVTLHSNRASSSKQPK